MTWLGFAVLLAYCSSISADARSMVDFPLHVRRANVVRLSRLSCDDCAPMADFLTANRLVFVLFHERSLIGKHHYKAAIVAGFHDACKDLRFSEVVCGVVDMLEDKEYATPYIDPKTAPAHIIMRHGQPERLEKHHLKRLMEKPGDKATILWHLKDVLAPSEAHGHHALQMSTDLKSVDAFDRLVRSHQFVVAGAIDKEDLDLNDGFRGEVQRMVLAEEAPMRLKSFSGKGSRGRVMYAVTSSPKLWSPKGNSKGTVALFINGTKQLEEHPLMSANGSDPRGIRDAIRSAIQPLAALETEDSASQPPKRRRRSSRRRSKRRGDQVDEL